MSSATVIALSISGGIKTLGAYAGLAAVVALALLILLYFAHARELKRLSELVAREAQRQRAPAGAPGVPRVFQPPPLGVTPTAQPASVPVPVPAPGQAPAPTAALPVLTPRPAGASPLAASVEGVRRVPLPGTLSDHEATAPQTPAESAPPDATTVSELPETDAAPALPPPPPPDSEPEPTRPPRLIAEAVFGLEPGSVHEIGDGALLGRGKASSIRFTDPLASGRHARVAPDGELVVLEDLGSTNGTFLNGVLISAPTSLNPGDRIRLGESEFLFDAPSTPRAPATETAAGEGGETDAMAVKAAQDATEVSPGEGPTRPAAVPLLARPIAEQSFELRSEAAGPPIADELSEPPAGSSERPPVAEPFGPPPGAAPGPPPAPHPDSPLLTAPLADGPQRRIRRYGRGPRAEGAAPDRAPGTRRRLRFGGGELPSVQAGQRRLLLLLGLLAIAVIAAVVIALGSSGGSPSASPPASRPGGGSSAAAPPRSRVSVAVLNATNITGLATQLETQLTRDGFAKGPVGNQGELEDSTTVGYTAGHGAAAAEVARALGLSSAGTVALTSAEAAKAAIGGARPQVVVIAGVSHPQ